MPIFDFLANPTQINFEDEILLIVKNFIKKTGKVSDIIYQILPALEGVFVKNKNCFADSLLDTLNAYLIHGRDRLLQDYNAIQMLVRISQQALFCIEPTITVNNSEGAIFMQILFQIFQGTPVLDEFFEGILNSVLQRLNDQKTPAKANLKKHLLQVFLSALVYNPGVTIKYMAMKEVTQQVIVELINAKKKFKSPYEHKLFVVGITQILTVFDAPDNVRDASTISRLLQENLFMLEKIKKKEAKDALKRGRKQVQDDDEDDNSDDSDEDTSSEDDEDDEITQTQGKRSRGSSQGNAEEMMQDDTNGGGLGFTNEESKKMSSDEDDDEEYDNEFELSVVID